MASLVSDVETEEANQSMSSIQCVASSTSLPPGHQARVSTTK